MDEYISSIFLNGRNTIVLHNTCEDSLLAAPIILDLAILTEFFQRFRYAVLSPSQKENEIGEKGAENKKDLTKDSKHREKMVENGRKPAENGEALESCENGRHLPEIDGGVAGDEPALARLLKRRMAGGAAGLRFRRMEPVLSMLAYLLKAPKVPDGEPVVNVLFRQRACLENIFRACVGLEPESNMLLEHKCPE